MAVRWISGFGRRPKPNEVVVIQLRSMMGNPVFETATYEGDRWVLEDGAFLERPDWIQGWCRTPALPANLK